jgi:hypothetical protein
MTVEYDELPPPTEEFKPLIEALKGMRIDEMVKIYRDVRDELSVERKAFKQKEANSKDLMARISMALRDKADELGVDTFNTPFGTAYRNVKKFYRVGNWDKIIDFIKQTGNFQMLEKRVAKNATAEIHDALGEVPPGIDFSVEVEFAVRKPTAKKGAVSNEQ